MSATDVILSDASEGIYVYQTSFRISYTNREPVPVQEVIKSLQALQGILPKVPDLIEGWLDVKISYGEFFIESLETGSLIEDILMKLYFANQEELDAFMAKIRSNPMLRNSLAGLALGVLVTWGAMTALGSKTPANQVTIANSTIINVGAQQTGLTPEAFEAVVRQAVGDQKKKVAENAVKLVHPAKADPQAEFQISGTTEPQKADQPVLRMTPEQVAAVPVDVNIQKNERIVDKQRVPIVIRAVDLDSDTSGWKGRLSTSDDIVKIELDPKVNKTDIYGKTQVIADVSLIYTEKRKKNELTLEKIFIRQVH